MTAAASAKKENFRAPAAKWWQAIAFFFMLSLVGLQIYPIYLPLLMWFIWRWRNDRYSFLIELMIFMGSFGFISKSVMIVPVNDIALILGIIGFAIYRKNNTVKHVALATLAYFAVIVAIAMTSLESLSIQFYRMRGYFVIISFFVPLLAFVNRPFDWNRFSRALTLHALVICGFYVVDTFIIGGFILVPAAYGGEITSTIFDPYISGFLSMPRHYPPGLYWLIPCVIWMNYKQLRFSPPQWILILLALYASRTNSLLFALIACWILFRPETKKILIYAPIAAVALVGGYFIDDATGRNLRLADNFDQFVSLDAAQDEEDLAEFGSGRMAQIIPKWMLLEELNRVPLGFGFIHPVKTTNPIFQIHNDLYVDQSSEADEVATEVEVTQVQTILDIGVIGLIFQAIFYIGVYFIIRKLNHSKDYLNVLVGASLLGIGGFAGLNSGHGPILIATILGAILAANKPLSLKKYSNERV